MRALLVSVLVAGGLSGCVMGGPYGYGGDGGGYDPYGGYGGAYGSGAQQVRCESTDGRARHCPMDVSRGVQLVRQLSDSACVRGSSWGVDRGGVWVSNGCRADFASGGYDGGYGDYGGQGGYGQTVRCESTDGRFRSCPADTRGGVTLLRQLSGSPCIQGQTWGWDQRGVWVNRGCRADFRAGGGWGGYGQGGYGPGYGTPRTVRCESSDGRPHRCDTPVQRAVLQRQLSSSRCVQGQTWGWDPNGVWVAAGCRADFSVW
ncbi:MAG TPA: DUF3011 domain-containing protein [Xanthomonadaceae bacterium]|nr:DUF3011 domain-containing protein [Xanthomonadaceae bacterium]